MIVKNRKTGTIYCVKAAGLTLNDDIVKFDLRDDTQRMMMVTLRELLNNYELLEVRDDKIQNS